MSLNPAILEQIFTEIEYVGIGKTLEKYNIRSDIFFAMLDHDPAMESKYTRALKHRTELLVDKIPDIAKECLDPQRARVEIDALKWYASKMEPKKYSDRLDINLNQTVDIVGALTEARSRLPQPIQVLNSQPQSPDLQSELDALLS